MQSTMRAFVSAAARDQELLREAAEALNTQVPGSAAWLAVACGTVVERGAAADVSGPAVIELLRSWLSRLASAPVQATLLSQFRFVCQAAVTHLARLPALRERLGQDAALLEQLIELSAHSHGAWWVREALVKSSGVIVVLHPPGNTGLRLRYSNVSNCFHLFSLLQTAVGTRIPGGRTPDESIARVARGKSMDSVSDEAWWHYGSALSPKPAPTAGIPGEGLVRDIPRVAGEQVLLLWPPLEQRTWDAGFLGPHLEAMPADATVEQMLTTEETHAWLEKTGAARAGKAWWRFW